MTYSAAELLQQDVPYWFCVKANPKHEHVAAAALRRNLQLECFAPRIRFRKNTRRGPVWFVEAMFPSYLFARFNYAEVHRHVRSMPGVQNLVHFGDRVASIPDATIASLRTVSGEQEMVVFNPEVEVGKPVAIVEGAFQGLEAVVTQVLPARDRVKVLLEFLGRTIEAEISRPDVLPTLSPRGASLGK